MHLMIWVLNKRKISLSLYTGVEKLALSDAVKARMRRIFKYLLFKCYLDILEILEKLSAPLQSLAEIIPACNLHILQ